MRIAILILILASTAQAQFSKTTAFVGSSRTRTGGITLEAETLAYATNIANNGGTISASHLLAVNNFVVEANTNSFKSDLIDWSPLAGDNTNAAVVKLFIGRNSTTNITWRNSTSGDIRNYYQSTNGWTIQDRFYLETRFYPSNFISPIGRGVGVWFTKPTAKPGTGTSAIIGQSNNDGTPWLSFSGGPSFSRLFFSDNHSDAGGLQLATGQGFYYTTQVATNQGHIFVNGRQHTYITTSMTGGTNTAASPLYVGGYYYFGHTKVFTNAIIGCYGIDGGMTSNKQFAYNLAVKRLMTGLGRIQTTTPKQKVLLVTGQSNAAGGGSPGSPSASDAESSIFNNYFNGFAAAVIGIGTATHYEGRAKTFETTVTSGWKAFQDQLSDLSRTNGFGETNDTLVINYAVGGAGYSYMGPDSATTSTYTPEGGVSFTTNRYFAQIKELEVQRDFQLELDGRAIEVVGVVSRHGETDRSSSTYGADVLRWQRYYTTNVLALTGQSNRTYVPMFHTQPGGPDGYTEYLSNTNLLWVHTLSGGTSNVLVGPSYQYPFLADGVHRTGIGQKMNGEKEAQAMEWHMRNGYWEPLRPTAISRSGAVVTITFTNSGNYDLVLDTTSWTNMIDYGFSVTNGSGAKTISSVALAGATTNQVVITLASDPGAACTVFYGLNKGVSGSDHAPYGPRGNLRNTRPGTGFTTTSNLWDWAVLFRLPDTYP
jgi:hypothetical protein